MPDGRVIDKNHHIEIRSDRNEDFLRVQEDETNQQHKSNIEALKAAAMEWTFEKIDFVAGRCDVVVEDDSMTSISSSKG